MRIELKIILYSFQNKENLVFKSLLIAIQRLVNLCSFFQLIMILPFILPSFAWKSIYFHFRRYLLILSSSNPNKKTGITIKSINQTQTNIQQMRIELKIILYSFQHKENLVFQSFFTCNPMSG